ncbi:MAG: DsbA family oxidoreductase [Dehalococcoidia bacterium]|nr:DsbA family oxidoreductase [Dehalococcoidia bacterium]
MAEPLKVTVVSDYVCPWCYVGARRVQQFSELFEVEVKWWPFELHPETPIEGRHIDQILPPGNPRRAAMRDHLRTVVADADLPLVSNRMVANSHRALEAAEFARDRGKFEEMHWALLNAYFAEGRNVGDLEVVTEIVRAVGLDVDEWRAEVESGRYVELIDFATQVARQQGVTSTPTMVFDDRFVLTGAQDLNVYVDVLTRMGAKRKDVPAEA